MSYQVLARKYRPANFQELEGQEHVLRALVSALENERLHHAYLFTGTRGVGKTTIARILARCLNCETGITATPCNTCRTCTEISEGRSVDLLEVDAASKTGIDDMRELLDNVQYLPSSSRFKVYLIDEVHMLSRNAFNAMLKTLEEPPEHVKFLFATTDPKKLPVTILSRCLQFNLKNLTPERVVNYLKKVLDQEQVSFEDPALWQLGRAAEGSMRDALSLTDQAIAYGQGKLVAAEVSAMLGTVDRQVIYRLLDRLGQEDAAGVLAEIEDVSEYGPDYAALLNDLLAVLHRVSVAQLVPGAVDNSQGDQELIEAFAHAMAPEQVQLFYQIALIGKRDLPLAPDPRVGFEMVMLRMLAFITTAAAPSPGPGEPTGSGPAGGGGTDTTSPAGGERRSQVADILSKINAETGAPSAEPRAAAAQAVVTAQPETASQSATVTGKTTGSEVALEKTTVSAPSQGERRHEPDAEPATAPDKPVTAHHNTPVASPGSIAEREPDAQEQAWFEQCQRLDVLGITRTLVFNCTLAASSDTHYDLHLADKHASLLNDSQRQRIAAALRLHHDRELVVNVHVVAETGITPAEIERREREAEQARAVAAIANDDNVQTLISRFNAVVDPNTIAPVRPGDRV